MTENIVRNYLTQNYVIDDNAEIPVGRVYQLLLANTRNFFMVNEQILFTYAREQFDNIGLTRIDARRGQHVIRFGINPRNENNGNGGRNSGNGNGNGNQRRGFSSGNGNRGRRRQNPY